MQRPLLFRPRRRRFFDREPVQKFAFSLSPLPDPDRHSGIAKGGLDAPPGPTRFVIRLAALTPMSTDSPGLIGPADLVR